MSADILREVDFLLYTVIMGAIITCIYDIFRILRRVIKHNLLWVSVEDLIFWMGCSVGTFYILYKENNGTLRWFAIMGALIGMTVYRLTLGQYIVEFVSKIISKILQILWKPFSVCIKKGKKRTKVLKSFLKKKLTILKKVFKIILCKQ